MRRKRMLHIMFALALATTVTGAATIHAAKLGDKIGSVLKGAGIVLITDALSKQLNDFINTVTLNKGVPAQAETKVVPVIALGSGTRAGAAQVTGPKELVDKVKVVVQIETKFTLKNLDVEVFVPSDSMNPLKFNRVEGVGVSALIDLRLSGI
ncbi:MAG TPA: hypothetical protein PLQ76_07765 [bacterium]|nr:hypothetical protein [bacterium]